MKKFEIHFYAKKDTYKDIYIEIILNNEDMQGIMSIDSLILKKAIKKHWGEKAKWYANYGISKDGQVMKPSKKGNGFDCVTPTIGYDIKEIKKEIENLKTMKDLSKYSKQLAELTNNNQHGKTRMMIANLTENKILIEKMQATQTICRLEGSNPIVNYTYKLYDDACELGRKKYGKDWEKYIEANL